MSLKPRTNEQLILMRKSGEISAKALKRVIESAKEGVSLEELDKIAEAEITSLGGEPSFKTVEGYHWTTCLTINEEVVHGIPRPIVLKKGDVLSIDIGTVYQGWHTDTAWSLVVGDEDNAYKNKFLAVGEEALWKAIKKAVNGNKVGDISSQIEQTIEGAGYKVVKSLVGHGVGEELHEDPEIPGLGREGTGPLLQEGMTIAIESIYTVGTRDVILAPDGWTISSEDGSWGGLFEMTVIVGKDKPEVLTDWRKY